MRGIVNLIAAGLLWLVFILGSGFILLIVFVPYLLLMFKDADKRALKAEQKLQSSLMKSETVLLSALQKRIYALASRRQLIGITNSRMILIDRPLFGGFTMKDYQWKDLLDAQLSENILPDLCGSRVEFKVNQDAQGLALDGIDSQVASEIYSHSQAQEQEWEEKRRIRSLEEMRAVSGGTIINNSPLGMQPIAPTAASPSMFDDIERAKKLFDAGTISDVEYQELKAKILNRGAF